MKGKELFREITKLVIDNQLEEAEFDVIIRKVLGKTEPIKLNTSEIKGVRSDGTNIIIEIA